MKKIHGKISINILILFIGLCTAHTFSYAQDLLEDVNSNITLGDTSEMFSETIEIISRSGKIFIITNSNQLLSKGDFVTMALKTGGPVARAVIAKTSDGKAGLKVLKVYSLTRWGKIRKGLVINLLKGDDTALFIKKKPKDELDDSESKIESEEDLFNEKAIIEEDLSSFYQDNRHIKPDNIVTAGYNQFRFTDKVQSEVIAENQWNFAWAYQFSDNYWVEGLFGRIQVNNYPVQSSQTLINNFTVRAKYVFKAPLYSYLIPYVGVQTYSVSSPDAGKGADANQNRLEEATIDSLNTTRLIVGVTILRRLVPGWFLKADLGTDITSFGFGIEF